MRSKIILTILFLINTISYAELKVEDRGNDWTLNNFNPKSLNPTSLKYFHFYDVLPEEINFEIFKDKDLSNLSDRKLLVGYGIADPKGKDCISMPVVVNGVIESKEVCLPWWRIEREYQKFGDEGKTVKTNIFEKLRKPRPPLLINVCEKKEASKYYEGGKVVCTTYYDRLVDKDCWDKPKQSKCFVDNCGQRIVEDCTFIETIVGDDTTLETAVIDKKAGKFLPTREDTKTDLASHVFQCKGGSLSSTCASSKDVLMFPYECKLDDPSTSIDDGEYTYCDEKSPIYDGGGEIIGFDGKCSDGRSMICEVNKFQNTTAKCIDPIYERKSKVTNYKYESIRRYQEYSVDVLSGEYDIYSGNENCLRSNTIEDSRDKDIYARIVGDGYLDDDIYILRHSEGGDFYKTYCNMQHAGPSPSMATNFNTCLNTKNLSVPVTSKMQGDFLTCTNDPNNFNSNFIKNCAVALGYKIGTDLTTDDITKIYDCGEVIKSGSATKLYNGVPLSCLRNNGNYTFDEVIKINSGDIVSIQQNSEQEMYDGTPFAAGRNNYGSTKVVIDGIESAPETMASNYPYYPSHSSMLLRTWDNTTATFSLMFPFAGAYEIFFYNKNGVEMARADLDMTDFKEATATKAKNLKLGLNMALAPGITESNAGRYDDWVEWGGGVYGGKASKTGEAVSIPNDSYVKDNAITNIIVKDHLTGRITPVTLVYPLPYPNRIFISKLKVYEHRKYRCYNDFEEFLPPTATTPNKYVCSTNQNWINYKNGTSKDSNTFQKWEDAAMCQQNCFTQSICSEVKIGAENNKKAFTCTIKGGENLGGDLGGNYFSSLNACNSKCTIKNSCDTYNESNCTITDEQLDNQAQDFTGRTLYTKKTTNHKCITEETNQVGCARYDYTVAQGELSFDLSRIGYETKAFGESFEKAVTSVNVLEVGSQHIWSGWKGKCVKGMKMDSSYLSDPMTIASYAMSAYSAFGPSGDVGMLKSIENNPGVFGTTISNAAGELNTALESLEATLDTAYDNTVGEFGKIFSGGSTDVLMEGQVMEYNGLLDGVESSSPSWWSESVKGSEWITNNLPGADKITNSKLIMFGVKSTAEIIAPTEEEFKLAQKLLDPITNSSSDVSVQAYNSCLTSIGLSFPAMVGWSFDEKDGTSKQLKEPWKHPLRLTTVQLESLVQTMGATYVRLAYLYKSTDNINLTVYASNEGAYIKAGQVICAGHKVAQTMDYINIKRQESKPPEPSGGGAGVAASIAINAIAMVYPVVGLVLKIAMDLYTNMLTEIDTCESEEDAIQRSMNEYKTNKFKKNDLCRLTRVYCDKEMKILGFKKCVRDGYDFCCYDMQTTKIFAEALKEQLNHDWSSCQGITINDLKNVSFRECRAGEVPSINKCIATGKFDEYKSTLFKQASRGIKIEGLEEQIRNAIATEN